MGQRDGEKTLLFFLAGWLQDLEADKHLSWSWAALMFEDQDLDIELEPMQTCQAGYFEVTHRGTFFFFLDQLFPNSSLLVLLLQSLFLLSGLRWNILIFLAACFIVSQRQSFICVCVCTSFAYRQYILSSLCKIISL